MESYSVFSIRTNHSQTPSLMRPLLGHASVDGQPSTEKFKLKTLEEHQFATRFQEKRVTPRTWRQAKKDAHRLIASQDRINLVEALYLLLEIIWLRPKGSNIPAVYLNAGSIYLTLDHLDEAAKSYRNCLNLDPMSWKARYNFGVTLARSHDFVDANHQLDLALQMYPKEAVDEIQAMLEEIEGTQRDRNERAFKETETTHKFTFEYLQTLHCVAAKPSELMRTIAAEDHRESYRSGPQRRSPLLFHEVDGWQGAIAGLLHRLYTLAFARAVSVEEQFLLKDPTRSGCIALEDLGRVLLNVTGYELTASERNELKLIFEDGKLAYRFLVPNAETFVCLDEMSQTGVSHARLHWTLFRQRTRRREQSRRGGFWFWLDLSTANWLRAMRVPLMLQQTLLSFGWITPMDLVLKQDLVDPADVSLPLSFADRGVFVFECHQAQSSIRKEACLVLQMFFRRLVGRSHRKKSYSKREVLDPNLTYNKQSSAIADLRVALAEDTLREHHILKEVFTCLENLVDDVVAATRLERKEHEDRIRWQEIPIRTENRQKTTQAVSMLQSMMLQKTKTT